MRNYFLLLFLLFSTAVFAQKNDKPLIQFTGTVANADSSNVVVPYATITNTSYSNAVNIADYRGYFSFVVHPKDTLKFTCVGYVPEIVVIPANIDKSYTLQVKLKAAITNLPTVHVFPWATTDEFRKDFISMKLADDDLEIARKNLSKASLAEMAKTLPRDAHEIQSAWAQNEHFNILNSHSLMPNPLLNPIAWGSLINSIASGDKSRGN